METNKNERARTGAERRGVRGRDDEGGGGESGGTGTSREDEGSRVEG